MHVGVELSVLFCCTWRQLWWCYYYGYAAVQCLIMFCLGCVFIFLYFCCFFKVDRIMDEIVMARPGVWVWIADPKPGFYGAFKFYHPAARNHNKQYSHYATFKNSPCMLLCFTLWDSFFFSSLFFAIFLSGLIFFSLSFFLFFHSLI